MLTENGLDNNFGQPSVVYRVPIRIDRDKPAHATTTDVAGYGDWDGATGTVHGPDSTISATPGSGSGRLLPLTMASVASGTPVSGRVHVWTEVPPAPHECASLPADNGRVTTLAVVAESITAAEADVVFLEPADRGRRVDEYEVRYHEGAEMSEETFVRQGTPAPAVTPSEPGTRRSFQLRGLKASTSYSVGVRVRGGCVGQGPLAVTTFVTRAIAFKQLSGCFIATASYGSPLAHQLEPLRRVRDELRARGGFGAAAVGVYERSSPPLADLLRTAEPARAVLREALDPLVRLLELTGAAGR
jgi:hypothetical protein